MSRRWEKILLNRRLKGKMKLILCAQKLEFELHRRVHWWCRPRLSERRCGAGSEGFDSLEQGVAFRQEM